MAKSQKNKKAISQERYYSVSNDANAGRGRYADSFSSCLQ